ncbi:MAG TPA: hypothetical protein ENJ97_05200, partial [Planctomycetes bacterium]|nr:hypothetical protein [Planctomycetota bacterium]
MKRQLLALFFPLVLGAGAAGQSYLVHPPQYKNLEGESSTSYPFYYHATNAAYRQMIYQQVHDNLSKTPLPLKGIAFRRDVWQLYTWPAWSADVELSVSHSPQGITSTTLSRTFAANMGKDATVVIAKKKVRFPPTVGTGPFPRPFAFNLPFDTGKIFLYKGGGRSL